jgi:hypothetical protein
VSARKTKLTHPPDIVEFVTDSQLLGLSLSPAQETLLRGIYGLPLVSEQQETIWRHCTGRQTYPAQAFGEVTVIAGARGGKDSRIAAPVACYEAVFGGHEKHLAKGERAVIPLVAQDQRATRVSFEYAKDYLSRSPLLSGMVEEVLASEILLRNRVTVSCFPCTLRSLRGWSIPAGILDELAFFRLEGQADSDAEVQASIRRGMVSFPAPRLVKISTPYMRSGVLYDDFKKAWGQDNPDLLVWKASSILMNFFLRESRLSREQRLDPQRYAREYEAEFSDDLEAFLPSAWVDAAVVPGRHELPPREGVSYTAAADPSGGGADSFTLAIVHPEGEGRRIIQDVMKGWTRPRGGTVDLTGVVQEIAATLKRYGLAEVHGDKYAGGWVRQAFERAGISYRDAAMDKARAYLDAEPFFAQGRIALLDHPVLLRELKILERRPRAGGRTLVDHPHGGHDDYANVLALAAAMVQDGGDPDDLHVTIGSWSGSRRELLAGRFWNSAEQEWNVKALERDPRPLRVRLPELHGGIPIEQHAGEGCARCARRLQELGGPR